MSPMGTCFPLTSLCVYSETVHQQTIAKNNKLKVKE